MLAGILGHKKRFTPKIDLSDSIPLLKYRFERIRIYLLNISLVVLISLVQKHENKETYRMTSKAIYIKKETGRTYNGKQELEILAKYRVALVRDLSRNMRVEIKLPFDIQELRQDAEWFPENEIIDSVWRNVFLSYYEGNYSNIWQAPASWDVLFDSSVEETTREELPF